MRIKYKNILILTLLLFSSCTSTKVLLTEDDENKPKTVKVGDISINKNNVNKDRKYNITPDTKESVVKDSNEIISEEIAIINNNKTENLAALKDKMATKSKNKDSYNIKQKLDIKGIKNSIFYFSYDSYTLDKTSVAEIVKHAKFMQDNNDIKLRIEGYTDERGSRSYNLSLGENRALAVKNIMELYSVENRISVVSYGEEKPANSGHNKTAWKQNRRTKLIYY